MSFNITGTFQIGPTILEGDTELVTLRRYAASARHRDEIVAAMNKLDVVSLVVEVCHS